MPEEHADCESASALQRLVTVTGGYLKRWCLASGGEAQTVLIVTGFLIECMQEVDQVHQFLADVRGDAGVGYVAAAA
ncbi:hypothetical protein ACLGI4_00195 [Streptomyces sp. HMX112]|uniref:hypothetical protein n=1 Tax=Streptomyces sp. HMX112 TaxID=3390850 RepID=UPI003A8104C9